MVAEIWASVMSSFDDQLVALNKLDFRLNYLCKRRLTWSPKRMDSTHQKRLPPDARASRDVFHARLPWKVMVKLYKGVIPCQITQNLNPTISDFNETWYTCCLGTHSTKSKILSQSDQWCGRYGPPNFEFRQKRALEAGPPL